MIALRTGGPFVRLAQIADVDTLVTLAGTAEPGMSLLPKDPAGVAKVIRRSADSSHSSPREPQGRSHLLVLEDGRGQAIGMVSVTSGLAEEPEIYRYSTAGERPLSDGTRPIRKITTLEFASDLRGASQIGCFFLHPNHRCIELSSLLTRSCYLFIHRHPGRFADRLVARLPGWLVDGKSPFRDAGTIPLCDEYARASVVTERAGTEEHPHRLISRRPIDAASFLPIARTAIGRPNTFAVPALRMLEREGFMHGNYCSVSDGGPILWSWRDTIQTIRTARDERGLTYVDDGWTSIACAGQLASFRAWLAAPDKGDPHQNRKQ